MRIVIKLITKTLCAHVKRTETTSRSVHPNPTTHLHNTYEPQLGHAEATILPGRSSTTRPGPRNSCQRISSFDICVFFSPNASSNNSILSLKNVRAVWIIIKYVFSCARRGSWYTHPLPRGAGRGDLCACVRVRVCLCSVYYDDNITMWYGHAETKTFFTGGVIIFTPKRTHRAHIIYNINYRNRLQGRRLEGLIGKLVSVLIDTLVRGGGWTWSYSAQTF